MAGGFAALLDDIAALARLAAASVDDIAAASGRATMKAAGVVVDDAAVTPQYVQGISPKRELPIIWRIARGSLINKAVLIVLLLILATFVPWILTPLLMLGGTYLCFEGAEKVIELLSGNKKAKKEPAVAKGPEAEKTVVSGAVRTDFILSAEIMVISLNTIVEDTTSIAMQAVVLTVVALMITVAVYGAVALLVKMDDIGLAMAKRESETSQKLGMGIVRAMPTVMTVISYVGMVAMLWVGGHIILAGLPELGLPQPYEWVHHMEEAAAAAVPVASGFVAWLVNTFFSFILGLVWGAIIAGIVHVLPFGGHHDDEGHDEQTDGGQPHREQGDSTKASDDETADARTVGTPAVAGAPSSTMPLSDDAASASDPEDRA